MERDNPEGKVLELKSQIIEKMIEKGVDPTARVQQLGVGIVRVISDTDMDGWSSLMLRCDGEWSEKVAMDAFPLPDDLDWLLRSYSTIVDPDSREILGVTIDELDNVGESKAMEYIRQNREGLLKGLISALETTLQSI